MRSIRARRLQGTRCNVSLKNTSKVQKLAITAFVAVVMAFLFLNLFTMRARTAGLLDETIDTAHEFSRYPIDNYQLDFMWILH